jgi:hypothetical protein
LLGEPVAEWRPAFDKAATEVTRSLPDGLLRMISAARIRIRARPRERAHHWQRYFQSVE